MAKVAANAEAATQEQQGITLPQLGTEGVDAGAIAAPPAPPAAGTEEPKRKRGRPPKAASVQPQTAGASPEDIQRAGQAIGFTFGVATGLIAAKRGEHWQLSDEEKGKLGEVWALALAPWLPKIGAAMPWVAAIVTTGTVFAPRLKRERELYATQRLDVTELRAKREELDRLIAEAEANKAA